MWHSVILFWIHFTPLLILQSDLSQSKKSLYSKLFNIAMQYVTWNFDSLPSLVWHSATVSQIVGIAPIFVQNKTLLVICDDFNISILFRAIKDDGKRKKIQERLDELTASGYKVQLNWLGIKIFTIGSNYEHYYCRKYLNLIFHFSLAKLVVCIRKNSVLFVEKPCVQSTP